MLKSTQKNSVYIRKRFSEKYWSLFNHPVNSGVSDSFTINFFIQNLFYTIYYRTVQDGARLSFEYQDQDYFFVVWNFKIIIKSDYVHIVFSR